MCITALLVGCASTEHEPLPDAARAADSHAGAGLHLLAAGRLIEAQQRLERALAIDPEHAAAWVGMGLVAEGFGDLEQALAHQQRAAALAPEAGPVRNNLGRVLCQLGHIDEALETLQSAAELPEYRSRQVPLTNAARCAFEADRLPEAQRYVAAALAHEGTFVPARLLRAELYYATAEYAAAAAELARVRRSERSAQVLFWSAQVAQAQGDEEQASAYGEELRARFPESEYVRRLKAARGNSHE
ncbi:tetratricopeptide repeat protein [Halorhodospira abdelmalekii]|uniref:tetratricopeptide repeat protein n=1 Tax=Halorhodospira abdelmalekii TaxID=421629 RepID=UPI001904D178